MCSEPQCQESRHLLEEGRPFGSPASSRTPGEGQEFGSLPKTFAALAVIVPNVAYAIVCTSFFDVSIRVVQFVAGHSLTGDFVLAGDALFALLLYVFDWPSRGPSFKAITGILVWVGFVTGSLLKGRKYPAAIRVTVLLHIPLFLALLRGTQWFPKESRHESRKRFYDFVFNICLACSLVWLIAFPLWVCDLTDLVPSKNPTLQGFLDSHWWSDQTDVLAGSMQPVFDNVGIFDEHNDKKHNITWLECEKFAAPAEDSEAERATAGKEKQLEYFSACLQVETIMFFQWVSPLLACAGGFIMCVIFRYVSYLKMHVQPEEWVEMKDAMNPLVLCCAISVCGILVSCSLTSVKVNLTNGIIAMCFWGMSCVLIWLSFDLSTKEMQRLSAELGVDDTSIDGAVARTASVKSETSSILASKRQGIADFFRNEWVQAMLTGCGLVPTGLAVESARQAFRSWMNTAPPGRSSWAASVNAVAKAMYDTARKWNWPSVLAKVCFLGYLYFTLQVGGTKATYVFLSWMKDVLLEEPYAYSVCIVFVVGLVMFLLPPVPGVPVYVFCGIVLAQDAGAKEDTDKVTFFKGCAVAVGVGMVLKLLACTGQYALGYFAGQNVRVQKFVGVDTDNIQAIERILKEGKPWEKVAIFVGGPDWPTSVLSGILKVNLPTMLLLTTPVLFVMSPCVFAGAYMSKVTPTTRSIDSNLADGFMAAAAVGQLASMVLATYFITQALTGIRADDLTPTNPYPEAKALRDKEKDRDDAYKNMMQEQFNSSWLAFLLIVAATVLNVLSNLVFTTSIAFENFAVSGKIKDDLSDFGLSGQPLNIVKFAGWVALAAFGVSILLHICFEFLVNQAVERKWRLEVENAKPQVENSQLTSQKEQH